MTVNDVVLDVSNLSVGFRSAGRHVQALDDVSLRIRPGQVLGVVGESGCGKSTLGMSAMRLLPEHAIVSSGRIHLDGVDLLRLGPAQMRNVRGRDIGMIFQEPMTSLNPVMRIGDQISEVLRRHERLSARAASARAVELLDRVGIPDAERRSRSYPHQLSGGMRQRVVIAIAVACRPKLVIADEPTTALDATVQAQVLDLLLQLRDDAGVAILLITHNLGVVAKMADNVLIMYAGRVVESGSTADVLATPRHPYTARLLAAIPRRSGEGEIRGRRLAEIPGRVPTLDGPATACSFAPRCDRRIDICGTSRPELAAIDAQQVACFNPEVTSLNPESTS